MLRTRELREAADCRAVSIGRYRFLKQLVYVEMPQESLEQQLRDRLEEMAQRIEFIDESLAAPDVATDSDRLRELSIQRAALASVCEKYRTYQQIQDAIEHCQAVIDEPTEGDAEYADVAREELLDLRSRSADLAQEIRSDLVRSEERSVGSVILEVRAGVGGDEASLWAGDLVEMYRRFAAARQWKVEDITLAPGEQGGVRIAILAIRGEGVWADLGYEAGTHQVKRVPATESQGRIHTSTATVAVLPEPDEIEIDLKREDIEVHITTSQGPGGQNVNKVATAVHLIHTPTGTEVRIQETKSQAQNRERAWSLLKARLYEKQQQEAQRERAEKRGAMIGSGDRAEKIRTYRWKESIVVDHRIGQSFNLTTILAGQLDDLIDSLIERDVANRLAALGSET